MMNKFRIGQSAAKLLIRDEGSTAILKGSTLIVVKLSGNGEHPNIELGWWYSLNCTET